jgi:uncharacterized protein
MRHVEQLTAKLKRETGRAVTLLTADLSNRTELAKVEDVLKHNQSISLLLNNAGAASVAPLLNADVGKMEKIIALNVLALTRPRRNCRGLLGSTLPATQRLDVGAGFAAVE